MKESVATVAKYASTAGLPLQRWRCVVKIHYRQAVVLPRRFAVWLQTFNTTKNRISVRLNGKTGSQSLRQNSRASECRGMLSPTSSQAHRTAPPIGPHVLSQRPEDSCIMIFFRPLRAAVVCGGLGQLQKENVGQCLCASKTSLSCT